MANEADVREATAEEVLKQFTGNIAQRPPLFSACKVDGKRAYDLARGGSDMELAPKQIRIDEIELLSFELPKIRIRVVCGKGTYIRSLARDIGEALGSGAYLTRLTRTRVGEHKIEECIHPDDFAEWLDKHITPNINP